MRGVEKRASRKQSRASSRGREAVRLRPEWTDKPLVDRSPERSRSVSPRRSEDSSDSDNDGNDYRDEGAKSSGPPSPRISDSFPPNPPSSFHLPSSSSSSSSPTKMSGPSRMNSGSSFASYMSGTISSPYTPDTNEVDHEPLPPTQDAEEPVKYQKSSRGGTPYLPLIAHRVIYEHRIDAVVSMFAAPPLPRPTHTRTLSNSSSGTASPSKRPSIRRFSPSGSAEKEPGILPAIPNEDIRS